MFKNIYYKFHNMRIKRLIIGNDILQESYDIETTLVKYGFKWLNNTEIDNAVIEIKNNKLYWLSGVFYYGVWEYGIVLSGDFRYCEWKNGIFYNGKFRGIWYDGIFMNGDFEGKFIKGDMRNHNTFILNNF